MTAPVQAQFETALAHHREGRLLEAEQGYRQVIAQAPDHADAHNNLGVLLNGQNKPAAALACFERLAEIEPNLPRAHANRGVALKTLGRLEDAEAAYRQAIALAPDFHAAHNNLGNLLYNRGAYAEAQQAFEAACTLLPNAVDYRFMLAKTLIETQRPDRAEAELRRVLAQDSDHADAWGTLARVWGERHCPVEAQACFDAGLRAQPHYAGLRYNRGLARLLAGDLRGGFADYENRFDVPDFPAKRIPSQKPLWDGTHKPNQTLLLHAEQGLGDTLQMLRYVPEAAARVGKVLLLIQAPIKPVVNLPENVVLLREGEAYPSYDCLCPLLSLPYLLGTTLDAVPARTPYLRMPPRANDAWMQDRFQSRRGLRVGFVWAGNPEHQNDHNRSLPLVQLAPLIELDGVLAFSLQMGPRAGDLAAQGLADKVIDLSPGVEDFGDTAAVLQELDLLICVDTSIAHLAGGLGVPVWLLLPWMPDWRWLLARDDSPWYPSLRLFRQPRAGDWASVIEMVRGTLKALLHPRSAEGRRLWTESDLLVEEGKSFLGESHIGLAESLFRKAQRLVPNHPKANSALAITAFRRGDADAAVCQGERASRFNPRDPEVFSNQGAYLKAAGQVDAALACFEHGLTLKPDYPGLRYNRGLARLLAGDLRGGFADYESRFEVPDFPSKRYKTAKPLWDGTPQPDKTLLLHAEQGLGDSLQFVRYVPRAAGRVKQVLLLIQEPLKPLLALPPTVTVLAEGQAMPAFDLVCPLLSLPHLFETSLAEVPAETPYLRAVWSSAPALPPPATPSPRLRVGFVWAGNPSHKNDHNRSLSLAQLAPLIELDGLAAYSLQMGLRGADIATQGLNQKMIDLSPGIHDFGDTAAALQQLDLLICVDTSIAHLAGGLGLPVWLMLPWMPDWRWLLQRDDSPWYPSLRLFRQPRAGDWASVIAALSAALKAVMHPHSAAGKALRVAAEAPLSAGRQALASGRPDQARLAFWQLLRHCPTHAEAASALAVALYQQGRAEQAIVWGERAERLAPESAEVCSNLGAYYKAAGRLQAALDCQERAVQLAPASASALSNLSNTLGALGRWEAALPPAQQAVRHMPKVADFQYNLGIALKENARFQEALIALRQAQLQPAGHVKAALHEAMVELLTGDFAHGWAHYESRWAQPDCKEKREFSMPQWLGEPLAGKRLFVHAEQGFGDTLQFVRFVPQLTQLGAQVSLMVQPELTSLAARIAPEAEHLASGAALPEVDYHCPLLSLPHALATRVETIPAAGAYLAALPELRDAWAKRLQKEFGKTRRYRVGLVWAGRPTHGNDANRSLSLSLLQPLLDLPGIEWVGLQKGPAAAQAEAFEPVLSLGPRLESFEDTAAVLTELDELVSVDTAVAHLAGALGRPVRLLLPFIPDWRWLWGPAPTAQDTTPWYPDMRLYRQRARGDWADPIRRLAGDLAAATGQLNL